jgi:hypothetical protein
MQMEQTPNPEPPRGGEPPSAARSDAAALLSSTVRGCARVAAFLFRSAGSIDAAMGSAITARKLRTEGRSQSLSLVGSGAILIAAFAPLMNVPVMGAVTYFNGDSQFATATGIVLVALGIASLTLALVEKYSWLYLPGFCSVLIALGTVASWKIYQARANNSASAPPTGLVDYFTRSASKGIIGRSSLSFGLPLLIYGAVLLILAALVRPRRDAAAVNSEPRPG